MTCRHVLGLIDAAPFADYPRAHLDAAWRHARQCPTCGPALEAGTTLTADLAALPYPAPPPDLAAAVLARIAQSEPTVPARGTAAVEAITSPSVPAVWPAWATAFGGLAAAITAVVSTPLGRGAAIDVPWLRPPALSAGLVPLPSITVTALMLACGLAIYVVGLFTPFDRSRR